MNKPGCPEERSGYEEEGMLLMVVLPDSLAQLGDEMERRRMGMAR
jgi:hypothetical protein